MLDRLRNIRIVLIVTLGTLAQLAATTVAAACSNGGGFPH